LKAALRPRYDAAMRSVSARLLLAAAVASLAAGVGAGCNTGGLLVVQGSTTGGGGSVPDAGGPNVTDLVNGGNVATNSKYKIVYTLGQPSPDQNVEKSTNNRLNGGLVGAMNGPQQPGP
jgi:hypothetical protein